MTVTDVDAYLAGLDPRPRRTLEQVRSDLLDLLPDAEQRLSYGVPAFAVRGTVVAGFSAARGHLSYLPHSGTVIASLGDALTGYRTSKGAVRFGIDEPLPRELLSLLVAARLAEAFPTG